MEEKKKRGRPTNSPKDTMVRVRMDQKTLYMINECSETLNTNRSDVLRESVYQLYMTLKKDGKEEE